MNEKQYRTLEEVFEPLARARLSELAIALADEVAAGFTEIGRVDLDHSRGVGFSAADSTNGAHYVELILTDGDEYGFEGVGLILNCSTFASGQVWAPGNFTEGVGTSDPCELARRLQEMPVADVAGRIRCEWARLSLQKLENKLTAQGYDLDELERDNPYNQWMSER